MADKNTKRLALKILQEDLASCAALEAIVGYKPANPNYSLVNTQASKTAMQNLQTDETQAVAVAKAARDARVAGG